MGIYSVVVAEMSFASPHTPGHKCGLLFETVHMQCTSTHVCIPHEWSVETEILIQLAIMLSHCMSLPEEKSGYQALPWVQHITQYGDMY